MTKKPKIYIAGKLSSASERNFLEKISNLAENIGFETFLPHRDIGLAENVKDIPIIFKGDIKKGFQNCKLVVVNLNGLHVGAGTAWELGYAYAKNIPAIGIKTDEPIEDALESLSAIILHSTEIVTTLKQLEKKLIKTFKKLNQ